MDGVATFSAQRYEEVARQILSSCVEDQGKSFFELVLKLEALLLIREEDFFGVRALALGLGGSEHGDLDMATEVTSVLGIEGHPRVAGEILKTLLERSGQG